jgi:hypothetical protein
MPETIAAAQPPEAAMPQATIASAAPTVETTVPEAIASAATVPSASGLTAPAASGPVVASAGPTTQSPATTAPAAPGPNNDLGLQDLPPNQEPPHHDFQPAQVEDEGMRSQVLSESEENVYESDQQQYEQAEAKIEDKSLDKKNNDLSDRVHQEEAKLRSDNQNSNSTELEDDKQRLALDQSELQQQELLASNHSQNLEEFNDPGRLDMPESGPDDTQTAQAAPADPAAAPVNQKTELALNQPPRVPW